MEKKQNLNDQIYEINREYGAGTAAGMVRDLVRGLFEELQEYMRDQEFDGGIWTDDIDSTMDNWINKNI